MYSAEDYQALNSLADHIGEANDILSAYLDGSPTVEVDKELAGNIMLAATYAEELINLYQELYSKDPSLFPEE